MHSKEKTPDVKPQTSSLRSEMRLKPLKGGTLNSKTLSLTMWSIMHIS